MRGLSRLRRIASRAKRRAKHILGIDPLRLDRAHFVTDASGIEIPEESSLRRTPPRAPELRQFAYMSQFDGRSLFHDVFWSSGQVVLIGPPLQNLEELVVNGRFTFDGRPPAAPPQLFRLDRTHRVTFAVPRRPRRMRIETGPITANVPVRRDETALFKNRRVLFTMSRNNDLQWIEDWIEYHVRAHGADAVLLYDNASDRYTSGDLLRRISAVRGVKAAVVVRWPYAFGPLADTSGLWDSDYCQHGELEDARRRFLARAEGILQVDVDELVVCPDGSSIFDRLHQSASGAIGFDGIWLDSAAVDTAGPRRHRDFVHNRTSAKLAAPKWAAIPSRIPDDIQMRVHFVGLDYPMDAPAPVTFRHFRAITTDWHGNSRGVLYPPDPAEHTIDQVWIDQMRRIGWSD